MREREVTIFRRTKRYSSVPIGLQIIGHDGWKKVQALDWNEKGFNFFSDEKILSNTVEFKRACYQFLGVIVWNYTNNDNNIILEIVLNDLLLKQIRESARLDKELALRITGLCRMHGKILEKGNLLAALGEKPSDKDLEVMVYDYKKYHMTYRYGVKVESEDWNSIVKHTLEATPGLELLEKKADVESEIDELSTSDKG